MSDLEARVDARGTTTSRDLDPENLEARRDVELRDHQARRRPAARRRGRARPATVVVHEWVRKAILLLFRTLGARAQRGRALRVPRPAGAQARLRAPRRARGARGLGAPGQLPRPRRDPDAQLRQHRRVGRAEHDGRHLGHGRQLRPGRGQRPPRRAASASAACSSRRTRCRSSSRTTPSSGAAAWSSRARAWAGARCSGAGDHPHRVDPGHRRRDRRGGLARPGARLLRRGRRRAARREFAGGEFFLPCVLVIRRLERGRAPRQGRRSTPSCASTASPREPPGRRRLALVAIPSVSGDEAAIADHVESRAPRPTRRWRSSGSATTSSRARPGHHATRLLVAGHLDTVPGDPARRRRRRRHVARPGRVRHEGLARRHARAGARRAAARSVEVTWVFYAREEIARNQSGLLEVGRAAARPRWTADAAILAEPTGGAVEAGCQGSAARDRRRCPASAPTPRGPGAGETRSTDSARSSRGWRRTHPREVAIDGVDLHRAAPGGRASPAGWRPTSCPTRRACTLNHRVAPDRSTRQAAAVAARLPGRR